ncbi:MAG: cellobiose phosphorylase [Lachnospiraceae bacterium]|nr:cellobiose phosphorylase [Lachnospiraceae bacterium]
MVEKESEGEMYQFLEEQGTFKMDNPDLVSGLYFPIAGEAGLKGTVSPNLAGDSKVDQNSFLLEPVSIEGLHNNRNTRNFWCQVEGKKPWSATGNSAWQNAERFTEAKEKVELEAGLLWQKVTRENPEIGLQAEVLSFAPIRESVEIMEVTLRNIAEETLTVQATAMIPIYGRSADNIRDHRHVTSLLHRIKVTKDGVVVKPVLSFDERGHVKNDRIYFVTGYDAVNAAPEKFYATVEDFLGEGGSFDVPGAFYGRGNCRVPGDTVDGKEAVGGLCYRKVTLQPGETVNYTVLIGTSEEADYDRNVTEAIRNAGIQKYFDEMKAYWKAKNNITFKTGNPDFDQYLYWVTIQPVLRRIYGCSFLPHHDYGRGGRGWRDLWQDCLALLLNDPSEVRQMLCQNFGGVRLDGTNATIIGTKPGEFKADRNGIPRVWMDHGFWPYVTVDLYLNQTGDYQILDEIVPYFTDESGANQQGTVLEHLLLQNITAFFDVGEHGAIRLRGADWNDALDMAKENGESVAFSHAFAGNLCKLSELLMLLASSHGKNKVKLHAPVVKMINSWVAFEVLQEHEVDKVVKEKQLIRNEFLNQIAQYDFGEEEEVDTKTLAQVLAHMSRVLGEELREREWIEAQGHHFFNGYYDNHKNRVEGEHASGVRMMLPSQVFATMYTATPEMVKEIADSADAFLYEEAVGGYKLNTNFHEEKFDMGRMFGFAYGEKENGAVFSHMAVMYGNAMYQRGNIAVGKKALRSLANQALDFEKSKIYPGVPEYFDGSGRGLYHYLTGAASWFELTMVTEVFGVKGYHGDLMIAPKLTRDEFTADGRAEIALPFAEKNLQVIFEKTGDAEVPKAVEATSTLGTYSADEEGRIIIPRNVITENTEETVRIRVKLA